MREPFRRVRRNVENVREAVLAEEILDELGIRDGAFDECRASRDVLAVSAAEVVEDDDVAVGLEEVPGDVGADEAGAAGDENRHRDERLAAGVPAYTCPVRTIVLIALASLVLAGSASALPPRLAAVHTWAFAIGNKTLSGGIATRYAGYDLVVADGQEVTRAQVATLHDSGALVLGYLDAGTIEPYRPWYPRAKPYRLNYWKQWGEWYANVNAPGYRKLLLGVARSFEQKGLDGLFLDNTDMIETHPKQAPGMRLLVAALAKLVHGRGGFLFAQNGADVAGPIVRYLDGWNREDVGTDPAAVGDLYTMHAHGLLTLATAYVKDASSSAVERDIQLACGAGALPFVSDLELTRIPQPPPHC